MSGSSGHGLVASLATGLKDVPRNASWLVGKALGGSDPTNGSGNDGSSGSAGVMDAVRLARSTVMEVLPGASPVEARLARARDAAARAQEAEQEALETAQHAGRLTQEVANVRAHEKARIEEVDDQQARAVKERVDEAQRKADEQVAQEREKAELAAHDVLSRERARSDQRVDEARQQAEQAQEEAEGRLATATELLAQARTLADEAAAAAEEAAQEARAQADRIAADAQREASGAQDAVRRAEQLQETASASAAGVAHTAKDTDLPGTLTGLRKDELVRLAAAQGVSGRASMSKQQLIRALDSGASARSGS